MQVQPDKSSNLLAKASCHRQAFVQLGADLKHVFNSARDLHWETHEKTR